MATTSPALTKPAAHQVGHHLSAEGWSPAQVPCPPARLAGTARRGGGRSRPPIHALHQPSQAERFPSDPPVWQALEHARLPARDAGLEVLTTNAMKGARTARATRSCAALPPDTARFRQLRLSRSSRPMGVIF